VTVITEAWEKDTRESVTAKKVVDSILSRKRRSRDEHFHNAVASFYLSPFTLGIGYAEVGSLRLTALPTDPHPPPNGGNDLRGERT
jgi:hypothetical protein